MLALNASKGRTMALPPQQLTKRHSFTFDGRHLTVWPRRPDNNWTSVAMNVGDSFTFSEGRKRYALTLDAVHFDSGLAKKYEEKPGMTGPSTGSGSFTLSGPRKGQTRTVQLRT
jgi:hypothetical protein